MLDGDHNYYTVANELRLIAEAAGDAFPFVMFHDVCWPHGRRDDYYAAEQIPEGDRHPVGGGKLVPGDPGVHDHGLEYPRSAAREGGPRNGVLTADRGLRRGPRRPAPRRRARVLRLRRAVGPAARPGPTPSRRSSTPGIATRSSSGSRPTASAISPRRTPATGS